MQTLLGSATLLAQDAAGPGGAAGRGHVARRHDRRGPARARSARPARRDPRRGERGDAAVARARRRLIAGPASPDRIDVSRARNRPPKLEPRVGRVAARAAADRSKRCSSGRRSRARPASGPGPTELRRNVERLVAGDRRALGEIAPIAGLDVGRRAGPRSTARSARRPTTPVIDPAPHARRDRAPRRRACARSRRRGARVAIATARPASLLTLHLAFARLARARTAPRSSTSPTSVRSAPTAGRRAGCAGSAASRSSATATRCATTRRRRGGARVAVRDPAARARDRRRSVRRGRVGERDRGRGVRRSRPARARGRRAPARGAVHVVPLRTDRPARGLPRRSRTSSPAIGRSDRPDRVAVPDAEV